jgi:SAM-dependent methyltransferase
VTISTTPLWVCPRCQSDLPHTSGVADNTFPLSVPGRIAHSSASLERYASTCPKCGLPYTANGLKRFDYPYRQLLADHDRRRFLAWSAAQNNGFVSYSLMRGSSCAIEGRSDVEEFAEYIAGQLETSPDVVLDIGCGPLAQPAYLPATPGATLIGLDPFGSEWSGSFINGAGEFLPLKSGSVDLVVAATSLDHTLDLDLALSQLARVTRSGGSLIVWDHTLETRGQRWTTAVRDLASGIRRRDLAKIRKVFPERVRVYDNGIVLWTPRGYADPFHEPRSRRTSWFRVLRRSIERVGFTVAHSDPARGFSHYVKR